MMPESELNDKQKELLESFPKRDRGLFGGDMSDEEAPDLVEVEDDFVEAAAKKAKLK